MTEKKKRAQDPGSSKRSKSHLIRLAESGGKPIRVDTHGDDLKLLDDLVAKQYAPNRSEAYRKAMREAHAKLQRKLQKNRE